MSAHHRFPFALWLDNDRKLCCFRLTVVTVTVFYLLPLLPGLIDLVVIISPVLLLLLLLLLLWGSLLAVDSVVVVVVSMLMAWQAFLSRGHFRCRVSLSLIHSPTSTSLQIVSICSNTHCRRHHCLISYFLSSFSSSTIISFYQPFCCGPLVHSVFCLWSMAGAFDYPLCSWWWWL